MVMWNSSVTYFYIVNIHLEILKIKVSLYKKLRLKESVPLCPGLSCYLQPMLFGTIHQQGSRVQRPPLEYNQGDRLEAWERQSLHEWKRQRPIVLQPG